MIPFIPAVDVDTVELHERVSPPARGPEIAAIVDGHTFLRDGHILPFGNVGRPVVDAVAWGQGFAIATAEHTVVFDDRLVELPGPILDLTIVDGELFAAVQRHRRLRATRAGRLRGASWVNITPGTYQSPTK